MKNTLRLTETEMKRLVRKIITEQSLPEGMMFSDSGGKKFLLAGVGTPCSLSEIMEEYEKMKKFINSLPNGKLFGDVKIEADHEYIELVQKFASSMSIKDLEAKYK
jgi:hypothetical protein